MPFVLIKNYGVGEEWDTKQVDGLAELIAELKVKEIEFPRLPMQERNLLDKNKLTLGAVRTSDVFKNLSVSRDRVEKFLRKAYISFESTGLLP